ncbi:hypothetical protein BDV25DRAFT_138590 [Aspergillus avenaceus]|uniref:Xylanolytic transcriptional activator regulatory domain-containing protein n=1 Tax=Aspergillus avenaceus TaxID=36643 RepID=A0A5N6TZ74_ASPAV|nr:hypothetical protein BDV25DRAFT_138590 [Aspergillus avenaceus]
MGATAPMTLQPGRAIPLYPEILHCLDKSKEAVSQPSKQAGEDSEVVNPPTQNVDVAQQQFTSLRALHTNISNRQAPNPTHVARQFPPIAEARELFDHFAVTLHPHVPVLHIPSAKTTVEQTYLAIIYRKNLDMANLLLLLGIFSSSIRTWTNELLQKLGATPEDAKVAFSAYSRLALDIIDGSLKPSTTALAAMLTCANAIANSDGFELKTHTIRLRCHLMARAMRVHLLDSQKSREERKRKQCDIIKLEVQRRAWWHMVATDWLHSFWGGPQEGTYTFQPKHMKVDYPSNADDEWITSTELLRVSPLSQPTLMSAFIYRIKLADLCRQVVDTMSATWLSLQEPNYDDIISLGQQFHDLLHDYPTFFKYDHTNIEQSKGICQDRPYITIQRITVNFDTLTRLCKLHRPYHLESMNNPKCAYSKRACVLSARTMLQLRRSLDGIDAEAGLIPARFWTVLQHVLLAALVLVTDASFNQNAPDAEAKKARILAIYQALERPKQESSTLVNIIVRNMQIIMSTIQRGESPKLTSCAKPGDLAHVAPRTRPGNIPTTNVSQPSFAQGQVPIGDGMTHQVWDRGDAWDQLWHKFLAVALNLEDPQWKLLLHGTDSIPLPS